SGGNRYEASDLLPTCADSGHDRLDAVTVDGLDALGRDGERDAPSLRGHVVATSLDVRVPTTAGPSVGVRDDLAETRLPSRYLAVRRHGVISPSAPWSPCAWQSRIRTSGGADSSTCGCPVAARRPGAIAIFADNSDCLGYRAARRMCNRHVRRLIRTG